jgi:hypothetical protein
MGIGHLYKEGAYENLHDPFPNVGKPKSFNKTVVRPMAGPEKEPEILERPSGVTAPLKVVERPASPPTEKKGRGRPRSDKPKPWEALGLSQAAYYRKKSKGEVWWLGFRTGEYLRVRLRKSLRLRIRLLGRARPEAKRPRGFLILRSGEPLR